MADTVSVNVTDITVPEQNHVNIAIINRPNPVKGYPATADEVAKLIQFPNYFITDENGEQVSGLNYYKYFPKPGGGGGGGSAVLIDKTITENGEYNASTDNADGYSSVDVSITIPQPVLIEKTITENGEYAAVDDNADGYSAVVVDVPSGGGSIDNMVTLYDYDGTVIASYTPQQFSQLESYPTPPSHEYLTFDTYSYSLDAAKTYVATYGFLNIGAIYNTTDGATKLFVTLSDSTLSPNLKLGINGSVDVDWGDGSAHDTMVGTNVGTPVYQSHTYSSAGNYVISFSVTGTAQISRGLIVSSTTVPIAIYALALKKIFICGNILIGNEAFKNHYTLSEISIPDSVTSIEGDAFNGCYALTSVTIPDGVTSIKGGAFNYCYSLTSITIPDSVTSIDSGAFNGCNALTSITIPDSVTSIGNGAFTYCNALTSITIPDSVTSIGSSAFTNCHALTSVTIPDGVTSIGSNTFSICYALTSITIPDSVTSIENNAFNGCYALTSITIPNKVTSIGNGAFYNCYTLTSITIPNKVTSIGSNAFRECHSLGYIRFESETPPTVSNSSAFTNIPTTCKIYVPSASLSAYESATNYPSSSTYTYVGY